MKIRICPFCRSSKIMCEGTDSRCYMVCQKCLARGPEVPAINAPMGKKQAIKEWNGDGIKRFTRAKCSYCEQMIPVTGCGLRYHAYMGRNCPGSNTHF